MDIYPEEIVGDSEESKKRRKKIIQNVKKARYRQYTFNLLSTHVGKGEKNSLKKVKVINSNGTVLKECLERESIEREIWQYNKKTF